MSEPADITALAAARIARLSRRDSSIASTDAVRRRVLEDDYEGLRAGRSQIAPPNRRCDRRSPDRRHPALQRSDNLPDSAAVALKRTTRRQTNNPRVQCSRRRRHLSSPRGSLSLERPANANVHDVSMEIGSPYNFRVNPSVTKKRSRTFGAKQLNPCLIGRWRTDERSCLFGSGRERRCRLSTGVEAWLRLIRFVTRPPARDGERKTRGVNPPGSFLMSDA